MFINMSSVIVMASWNYLLEEIANNFIWINLRLIKLYKHMNEVFDIEYQCFKSKKRNKICA